MLFSYLKNKTEKPTIALLYGNPGTGKTETAKYINQLITHNKELLRVQFSMFQNSSNMDFLFGSTINKNSFAKKLIDRQSNILLFDEFDKCNISFYNAFYQLFDEGMFVDSNYTVDLNNSLIICTSNYISTQEIKKNLGNGIFSRIDYFIKFEDFSTKTKEKLIENEYFKQLNELSFDEKKLFDSSHILNNLIKIASSINNMREIKNSLIEL